MFLGEQNSYLILNGSLVYSLTWGAAPDVKRYCQSKLTWDGQGHFVPQSNNKTLPIPLRKICPKVTAPSCLGPWTGNHELGLYRTIEHAPSSCLQRCLGSNCVGWFCSVRGPWTNGNGLLHLIHTVKPQAHGPGPPIPGSRVLDHGPLVLPV